MKTIVYVLIVVAVIIAASSGTYVWYNSTIPKTSTEPVVENGSYVSVLYYGYILYPGGQPKVFDTNIQSVAQNNVSYPKTLTYTYSGNFAPLNFTAGSGQLIKGFSQGVIGMYQGETKKIIVPPSEGYPMDWSKVINISVTHQVPVYQTLTISEFTSRTGASPVLYAVTHDKVYGWNDQVLAINSNTNTVTISNNAEANQYYYPYLNDTNYQVYVNSISQNQTISITVIATPMTLLPGGGIIEAVNSTTITINYNKEVAGQTLYFVVTILKVSTA
ncbi:MAG: FKBP-type peptidyl-prolyl cis-trans isomerase [Thermoplasmata archaeon]